MRTTIRTADQDEIRSILTTELEANAEGLKLNKLVKCILDVASETTEKAITEVLDQIASVSEGNYILKPKNNGGSPRSTEESASSDSLSGSESDSDSVSDSGSGSYSNSGSGSDSKSSSDSELESGNAINSYIANRNDESESKKQKVDEDEDVDVDVDESDSGESKEDEDIDVDKGGKSKRVSGGNCQNRSDDWKSDKQKEDEDESQSKKKKEDVFRGSGGEEGDVKMSANKPPPSKSAEDNPQKDGGDDQNKFNEPEESKGGDDNDSTDSWLMEIDGGDDEMIDEKGGDDNDSIGSWLMEIDGGDDDKIDDEDEPPEENIDPSYYDPHFIQAKYNVELVFDNEGYVSPTARKHVGYKEISTTKDPSSRKKRPLEDSTNLNRESEAANMRRPKKPKFAVVREGPILGSSRDQQEPPKRDSIQVKALKFREESKKEKATKNMPVNLEIVKESKEPEVTGEGVTTFEMPVLLNKHRATKGEGSTNGGAKEAEILFGKGKQPGLVELASKDQNGQANKGTTSFKGVSTESKIRPGKGRHSLVLSENVPKEQMKPKTKENTSIRGSSKESVTEPVQAKHIHAPPIKSFQEQKKPNRGEDTFKESCKVPDTTKPVQVKHPQPLILNSSEKQKQQVTKGKPSSKEGSKESGSSAPSQLKQSLASVDKHSQEQKKAPSKGAVSLREDPKESTKTGKDNQHKLCHSQSSVAQPTKEQRKVTKEQGKVTKKDVSLKRVTSKDSGTKSDKEKHLTSPIQKPKSTNESSWKISFKSSELYKYKNIVKDDTHGKDPLQKPKLTLEQPSGSTFMSTDDIEVRKLSLSTSMDLDGIVPKEVHHGKGGTASAKAVDIEHPPRMEGQNPNQRTIQGHIREVQKVVGVERDSSIQQKMGRMPIIVDGTHLDQIKNNIHGENTIRVIRKRNGSEEIRGATSNDKDMNDREPPRKEGKSQTLDTNEPCDAEEAMKNNDTEREEGEISDTVENDIINEDIYRSQGNRNEDIDNEPPELNLLTATQETEVQNDCYKKYLKEVPQQWEPLNNLKLYKEYVSLYEKRHNCYMTIRKVLERTIEEFKELKRNLDKAKHEKNKNLFKQLIQSIRKRHDEVENIYCTRRKAYMILHKELDNLKGHILSFYEANSNSMDTSSTSLMQH